MPGHSMFDKVPVKQSQVGMDIIYLPELLNIFHRSVGIRPCITRTVRSRSSDLELLFWFTQVNNLVGQLDNWRNLKSAIHLW